MRTTHLAGIGLVAATTLALSGCGGNIGAQNSSDGFPTGPVTITVGQAAGGSTDLIARAVADGMADALGVAVPVVNKPGANGALATQEIINSSPDGYNLVLLTASLTTITPLAVSEDEAVSLDDLTVLKGLSQDDYVLIASKDSGITSLEDLTSGPEVSHGTTGVGTGSQLAQSLLFAEAGVEGTTVPFDSGAPALTAVMGNQVQVATIQLGEAKPQIDAGTVVPLVVFSDERNQYLDSVPTAAELGYEVPVAQYRAVAGPKDMPDDVTQVLTEAIDSAVTSEAYAGVNKASLLTPRELSGDEVKSEWSELADTYRTLLNDHGLSLTEG